LGSIEDSLPHNCTHVHPGLAGGLCHKHLTEDAVVAVAVGAAVANNHLLAQRCQTEVALIRLHKAKHLCGHSHGGLDLSDEHNLNTKTLDVGWDDFGKPLSFDEVLTIMNKKSIFVPSDHHKKVNAVAMEE